MNQNMNTGCGQPMQGNMANGQHGGYTSPGVYGTSIPPMPPQYPQENKKYNGLATGLGAVALFISCVAIGANLNAFERINNNRNDINSMADKVAVIKDNEYDSDYFSDWLNGHDKELSSLKDDVKNLQDKTDSIGAEVEAHCDILRGQLENNYGITENAAPVDDTVQSAYGNDGMYQFQTYADDFMVLKDLGDFYFNDHGNNEFTLAYESGTETDPYILDEYTVFKLINVEPEEGGIERFGVEFISRDDAFDYINSLYEASTTDEMVMTFDSESRVVTSISIYTGR